jgi:hypothetical protein
MSKQDFMINLQADLMLSMALAMIKQKCPDTTALAGMDMNLGEWKSMMKLTPEELKQLEEMD